MDIFFISVMTFFWILLIYYSWLTVGGVIHRRRNYPYQSLEEYPSVSILIPAHNEGVVMADTLKAMQSLHYPGTLNVYLLDDNSSDETEEIGLEYSRLFNRINYVKVPSGEPKGKSRVLNYGLKLIETKYFLVYDADNQPEEDAVLKLVEAAEQTKNAVGAVGYVKTINAKKNLLTRMIALEFEVFQLLMQSGRWYWWKMGSLAGTNMLLRVNALEKLGGYDEYALAEDAELTIRIASKGWALPVVPEARTWEQEPEKISIFLRQRTRWLIGNIYLLEKSLKDFSFWNRSTFIHSVQHVTTYFFFVLLLFASNVTLILSLLDVISVTLTIPLLMVWFMSYVVYTSQILSAQVLERDTSTFQVFVGGIMYFTYAQLFLILLAKSIFSYVVNRIRKRTILWDKTERFKGESS